MLYYLISIQKLSDGSQPASMMAYDNQNAVLSAYYSTLASNYANSNLEFFSVTIMDEVGNIIMHDHRYKEIIPEVSYEGGDKNAKSDLRSSNE